MNIGGVYTDPFHSPTKVSANIFGLDKPWFGGLRIIGRNKEVDEGEFTTIGCDDGIHWWVLTGEFTNLMTGTIDMDFTPKAPGVGRLKCKYTRGAISFLEDDGTTVGNTWSRLLAQSSQEELLVVAMKHAAFNDINGLYVDLTIYKPGSFAGIRVISDRLGKHIRDEICVVGTDDGEEWWSIHGGTFVDKVKGRFRFDNKTKRFGEGKIHNGTLKFDAGDVTWTKMVPNSDLHSLSKESGSKM